MDSKKNLIDILNAIDEINSKSKKKTTQQLTTQQLTTQELTKHDSIPKLNNDLTIPADVNRLIVEAEKYKKISAISFKSPPTQNEFPLPEVESALLLTNEVIDNIDGERLKSIALNSKTKSLEDTNKKLEDEIKVLQKNNSLLLKKNDDLLNSTDPENFKKNTKENLQFIFKQVEKQKKLFLDLKKYSIKIENDSNVFKENYERLVIENHELKTKLKTTKEKIVEYEKNKTELLSALDQLNDILSKNNVVGKISPVKESVENNLSQDDPKIEPID